MYRELMGALTAGHVRMAAGAAVSHPGPQQVCLGKAGDDAAHGNADALSRREALGNWTSPPSRSELSGRACGRQQGGVRGLTREIAGE